jgi:ribosomal-protein-alanine N-acetyltransferase
VQFREYRAGDLEAIFALDQVCFANPFQFSRRAMRQFAEARNALTVVAEDEATAQIAGFCIAHVEGRAGYVVTLDVAAEHRRRGLAGAMMQRIEQQAVAAGCDTMELHVFVENDAAIAFYEREGYERAQVVRAFYGPHRNAYLYRKTPIKI